MKAPLLPLLTTLAALLLAGCESTGVSARIQEKPAVYAALAPAQQQAIQTGSLDIGYTADMVYLSLGKPSEVQTKATDDGPITVWTYTRFYPTDGVAEAWSASRNQPAKLQVLFYQDKVFDATLEQDRPMPSNDLEGMVDDDRLKRASTWGMVAAGIYPNGPPPSPPIPPGTRPQ